MKTITTTAIVALMTATIGFAAIAPSYAQDAGPQGKGPGIHFRHHDQGPRHAGPSGFLGFGRGAEAVEIALVRLSHAIELSAEQQTLFDTLKTDALAAAETFSTAVEGLRPAAPVEGQTPDRPDFAERLENRIAIETAHLAALKAVQPSVTAFFDSLTDEQKAGLLPQRPDRDGGPWGKDGPRQGQHHGQSPGPALTAPPAPDANG